MSSSGVVVAGVGDVVGAFALPGGSNIVTVGVSVSTVLGWRMGVWERWQLWHPYNSI